MFIILRQALVLGAIFVLLIIFKNKLFGSKKTARIVVTAVMSVVIFWVGFIALQFVPIEHLGPTFSSAQTAVNFGDSLGKVVHVEKGVGSSIVFYGDIENDDISSKLLLKDADGWKLSLPGRTITRSYSEGYEYDLYDMTSYNVQAYVYPYSDDCYISVSKKQIKPYESSIPKVDIKDELGSVFTQYAQSSKPHNQYIYYCTRVPKSIVKYSVTVDGNEYKFDFNASIWRQPLQSEPKKDIDSSQNPEEQDPNIVDTTSVFSTQREAVEQNSLGVYESEIIGKDTCIVFYRPKAVYEFLQYEENLYYVFMQKKPNGWRLMAESEIRDVSNSEFGKRDEDPNYRVTAHIPEYGSDVYVVAEKDELSAAPINGTNITDSLSSYFKLYDHSFTGEYSRQYEKYCALIPKNTKNYYVTMDEYRLELDF